MSDIVNLYSESGRNIIGDDSTPTLELENSSSGLALNLIGNTNSAVSARTAVGSPTLAPIQAIQSVASGIFFDFRGAIVSTASINLAANQLVGAIRVRFAGVGAGGTDGIGFIPLFRGVV